MWSLDLRVEDKNGAGSHRQLSVDLSIESMSPMVCTAVDIYLVHSFASGVYADVFELKRYTDLSQGRDVRIFTNTNDIDYESVSDDESHASMGLQFSSIPLRRQCGQNALPPGSQCQAGGMAVAVLNYSLPLHLRYRAPVSSTEARPCEAEGIFLPAPLVYARCSSEPSGACAEFLRETNGVVWVYNATRLGDVGNHAQYMEACGRGGELFEHITAQGREADIVLRAPVGCMDSLDSVVSSTLWTIIGTTLLLMLLLCLK